MPPFLEKFDNCHKPHCSPQETATKLYSKFGQLGAGLLFVTRTGLFYEKVITQEDIDSFTKVRENSDYHASRINTIRSNVNTRVTALRKGNDKLELSTKLQNQSIFSMKPKHQVLYNETLKRIFLCVSFSVRKDLVLHGTYIDNSEKGAHVWSDLGHLICLVREQLQIRL